MGFQGFPLELYSVNFVKKDKILFFGTLFILDFHFFWDFYFFLSEFNFVFPEFHFIGILFFSPDLFLEFVLGDLFFSEF